MIFKQIWRWNPSQISNPLKRNQKHVNTQKQTKQQEAKTTNTLNKQIQQQHSHNKEQTEKKEGRGEGGGVLFCLLVAYRPSNMRVYLRDGSAQTILRAATLR